jgi:hypothetical protein
MRRFVGRGTEVEHDAHPDFVRRRRRRRAQRREVCGRSWGQAVRGLGLDAEAPALDLAIDGIFTRRSTLRELPVAALRHIEGPVSVGRVGACEAHRPHDRSEKQGSQA